MRRGCRWALLPLVVATLSVAAPLRCAVRQAQRLACFDALAATLPPIEAIAPDGRQRQRAIRKAKAREGSRSLRVAIITWDADASRSRVKQFAVGEPSISSMARWARCGWRRQGAHDRSSASARDCIPSARSTASLATRARSGVHSVSNDRLIDC